MARAAWFKFEVVDEVTPEEAQFRSALRESPHDAAARCMFADWLDEQGRADDALAHRLLGTRAVLVHDRRPGYRRHMAVWDVFVREGDPLGRLLGGELVAWYDASTLESYRRDKHEVVTWPGYLEHAAARLDPPFVRHCYRSPAQAEADLLRAYRALLQSGRAG